MKKNDLWYFQNTSYFTEHNKLLKTVPEPNGDRVDELINRFFKKYANETSIVITTEKIYKKLLDGKKKRIVIKVRNGIAFNFVRYTSLYVSLKRHHQRKVEKIPYLLQYCIYEGEYELKKLDLRHIKTTYGDFKLTHLYKYNSSIQLLRGWTRNDIIGPKKADKWEFNEPYFAIDGELDSSLKEVFNSTRNILNTNETIKPLANLKDVLEKQRINLRKKQKSIRAVKLSSFIHDTFFCMI